MRRGIINIVGCWLRKATISTASLWLATFVLATLPVNALAATAQLKSVSFRVEEQSTSEDATGKDAGKQLKKTCLKITVGNMAPKPLANVQVRYFLFAKDANGNTPSVAQIGSKRVSLGQGGHEQFESKDLSVLYSPLRYTKDKKGKPQAIGPSGQKYAGYVVQARLGKGVVGQEISSELKDKVNVHSLDQRFAAWEKEMAAREKPPPPKKKK